MRLIIHPVSACIRGRSIAHSSCLSVLTRCWRWPSSKVEMYCRCFKKMVVDLVEVFDGSNDMRSYVSLAAELFHPAPNSAVVIFGELRLLGIECIHIVLIRCFAIDPLFHLDDAGTVVDFVCDVRGLSRYATYLAYEGDLRYNIAVDFELCVWMWLVGVNGLFHCYWADCVLSIGLNIGASAE